jgi:choline dehydrogenase-like flavoprotein
MRADTVLPNLARKNLHFQTLSLVSRILWAPVAPRSNQPVTAVGVEYIQNGTFLNAVRLYNLPFLVGAHRRLPQTSKNVIVSSGALLTPRVLEHSGVGDPEILEPLGIRTVIAAPRVGENVQHHPGIDVFWRTKNGSAIRA